MSTIFALLFLFFAGFLVWGLISPARLSKFANKSVTRKEAGLGFGLLTAVFFVLTGVTAPKQSIEIPQNSSQQVSQISQNAAKPVEIKPVVETVTETQPIAYTSKSIQDVNIAQGTTTITTKGVNGVKALTYEVTKVDEKETGRKLTKEAITTQPITEIISVGSKPKVVAAPAPTNNCDPNYTGVCVPIASDVDCSSGSGNGPAYVRGPVRVVGTDIYDLDRDGNGIGCENG